MSTFWLKIAGVGVVVVGLIIIISVFSSSKPQPQTGPKNIYDVWEQDEKRLEAEPNAKPPQTTEPPSTGKPPVIEQPKPRFKKLSMVEEVQAQQLWEWVKTQRKMGRLPVFSYKQMVDKCREIIERWPDSEYAFKAKRALADIPERYHKMYNVSKEEMDVSNFYR